MSEEKSSNHRFIMAINVAIALTIVLVLVVMLRSPEEPSEAVAESQAEAATADTVVKGGTMEVHTTTTVAVMPVPAPNGDGVYGGAEFQASVNDHLIKQSATLSEEMDSVRLSGRTNDSLSLTPKQLRDLEASGNMIY